MSFYHFYLYIKFILFPENFEYSRYIKDITILSIPLYLSV